jgi:hypothetical protein
LVEPRQGIAAQVFAFLGLGRRWWRVCAGLLPGKNREGPQRGRQQQQWRKEAGRPSSRHQRSYST